MQKWVGKIGLVLALILAGTAGADVFKYQQGLDHNGSGTNYAGGVTKTIKSSTSLPAPSAIYIRVRGTSTAENYNSFIKFDGIQTILSGENITGSALVLTWREVLVDGYTPVINIYKVLKPWTTSCTWDSTGTVNWELPGARGVTDRELLGTFTLPERDWYTQYTDKQQFTFVLPKQVVQDWVDNPTTNYGLLLTMQLSPTASDVHFSSNLELDATLRPLLKVYTPAQPDINHDTYVDLLDLALLATEWEVPPPVGNDLTGDGSVNLADLTALAEHWLGGITQ